MTLRAAARATWTARLRDAAPNIDRALVGLLAGLLVSRATSDILFVVVDALLEAAHETTIAGRPQVGNELYALASIVADEAARRAPAHARV